MPFAVSHTVWLATEVERVKAFLLAPQYWRRKWTDHALRNALAEIGLVYTLAEITELNDALHTAGIVKDVTASGPGDTPA